MPEDKVIDVQPEETAVATVGETALMPAMSVQAALERYQQIQEFVKKIMVEGEDFGQIPGTKGKSLYKPGAEKLCSLFGLGPDFTLLEKIEQWEGPEPFFMYTYSCTLYRHGVACGQAVGSCNSKESKYRWRWVGEHDLPPAIDKSVLFSQDGTLWEPEFAIDKAETQGKYGKPLDYWGRFREGIAAGTATRLNKKMGKKNYDGWEVGGRLYRLPNPEIADQVHTISAMSQKRALVGAVRVTTGVSNIFAEEKPPQNVGSDMPPPPEPPPGLQPVPPSGKPPFDFKQMVLEFQNQKAKLIDQRGEEKGIDAYYNVLGANGVEHANEFSTAKEARRCWQEMQQAIDDYEPL